MMRQHSLLFVALWLLLSQCRKKSDPEPITLLPPATQTGANTLGFLLNGQAWLPAGSDGNRGSNFSVSYESYNLSTGQGGVFDLRTFRYTDSDEYYCNMFVRRLKLGTNSFTDTLNTHAWIQDFKTGCNYDTHRYNQQQPKYRSGNITITRLDTKTGIIAGTFEFTIVVPGCDTLRVTEGRFDKRI